MPGADLVEFAKKALAALTSVAGVAYACGYLVVRARCRALGADPAFAFVDQVYILAAFQFLLVLVLSLLISAPLLLLLRGLGRRALVRGGGVLAVVEPVAAVLAAALTILVYGVAFKPSGVLLSSSVDPISNAVLGRNGYGALLILVTTAGAAALAGWTWERLSRAGASDALGPVLALVAALLLALLPVEYGVFHFDRTARQLDGAPPAAAALKPPVWVVERATDHVTLFGRGADGRGRLLTVKAEQLDGIPVVGLGVLDDVLGEPKP